MKTTSYPKNKIKILLLENIHEDANFLLSQEKFQIEILSKALDENELYEKIKNVHVLGIRSKTNITQKVLENANKLLAIGAFCVGTNQIELEACQERGIPVFNAPFNNTRSVVEMVIGEIIFLMRGITDKNKNTHLGKWNKKANHSFEIRNKKLGIIGYGNIGSQLSVLAESMGMKVYFYDIEDKLPLGNTIKCHSLDQLLSAVDIVSLHIDGRKSNKNFFGKEQFMKMKKGSYFINLARGEIVIIEDLISALKSKKLLGSAVDVFPKEPKHNGETFQSDLQGLENVILTPHIGGSTIEAQIGIANYVSEKLISYINTGSTYGNVNLPSLQLPKFEGAHRLLHIHKNIPGVLANINKKLAQANCNILGQYLKTDENIGYVICDVNKKYDSHLLDDFKIIEGTIKFRVLY